MPISDSNIRGAILSFSKDFSFQMTILKSQGVSLVCENKHIFPNSSQSQTHMKALSACQFLAYNSQKRKVNTLSQIVRTSITNSTTIGPIHKRIAYYFWDFFDFKIYLFLRLPRQNYFCPFNSNQHLRNRWENLSPVRVMFHKKGDKNSLSHK